MSTHSVEIIEIKEVNNHPNADKLDIIPIGGWQVVSQKGTYRPGDKAVYIEPDYTVPVDRPEFSFLAKNGKPRHRLKAIRLRGELSYGLLVPVPEELKGAPVGTDVMEAMGIERYEPPVSMGGTTAAKRVPQEWWPKLYLPKFDLENFQRYSNMFEAGEPVIITEKVDGANARFVYTEDRMHLGSRTQWVLDDGENIWSKAFRLRPGIEEWCRKHPNHVLYGEVYGWVQPLRYGFDPGKCDFLAFAALKPDGKYWNLGDLAASIVPEEFNFYTVPALYTGPFDPHHIAEIKERDSVVASVRGARQLMEGVVIVPVEERFHARIGRVALKYISDRYWEMKD